jgi:hypothetical protein
MLRKACISNRRRRILGDRISGGFLCEMTLRMALQKKHFSAHLRRTVATNMLQHNTRPTSLKPRNEIQSQADCAYKKMRL